MNNDPLKREEEIIKMFDGLTNNKKIVKLAKKLYGEFTEDLDKTLCGSIALAKDPLKRLEFCRKRIADCYVIIEQFIEQGAHGMINHEGVAYPVKLDTRDNWLQEDKRWTIEDEEEIMDKAVRQWMKETNRTKFSGKIALFPKFGFSGYPVFLVI